MGAYTYSYGGKKWKWQNELISTGEKGTTENGKDWRKSKGNGCKDISGSWRY